MTGNSVSAVGILKGDHISAARQNLKIGQCFAALRQFEERVSGAAGVDILTCWVRTAKRKGIVASGQIVIRFPGDAGAYEIGSWTVWRHGRADVSLGSLALVDEPADVINQGLTVAWGSGVVTQAIRIARQTKPM